MEGQRQGRKVLCLAHLSDVHVEPGGVSAGRFADCLRRVREHPWQPKLILGGGDMIMDAMAAPRESVRAQWDVFQSVVKGAGGPPWAHCLGNHDIFGWDHAASGATGAETDYGKAWALDELGMPSPYYSFDLAGWHFVVLDSEHPWGKPGAGLYQAMLDREQFEWLIGDLASVQSNAPVLILSHHPFRSSIGYHERPPHSRIDGEWTTQNAWLHMDTLILEPIFALQRNIRLCLSGHMHQQDRFEHGGISYIASGAVAGDLWREKNPARPESCGILQLYDDGTFEYEWMDLQGEE